MNSKSINRGGYPNLDILKLFLAYLILARHLAQNLSEPGSLSFVLIVNTISTVGVPAFFAVSGFLLYRNGECESAHVVSQMKRILKLYIVWSMIYLPLNILKIMIEGDVLNGIVNYFQNAIFSGTYYHLWYLPALAVGTGVVYLLRKMINNKATTIAVVVALFVIGLFGDSWSCWLPESVDRIYDLYEVVFVTTRNGIFFAPVFVYIGEWIAEDKGKIHSKGLAIGCTILGIALLAAESWLLYRTSPYKVNNMMFAALLISPALVICCVKKEEEHGYPRLRQACTVIFCVHPWVIAIYNVLLKGYANIVKISFIAMTVTVIGFVVPGLSGKVRKLRVLY